MPNRIIKESIRTSKTVNSMTDFQFRVWIYLITYVDDYGRGSADPELIKGFVFPRRKRISESDIEKTLAELAGMGCISLYDVDGESYFYFPNWGEHQRIQTKKSKFPAPENGNQRLPTVTHGEPRPESESELESKSEVLESETRAREDQEDADFDRWWDAYPRKIAYKEAYKAFLAVADERPPVEELIAAVNRQKSSQQWQEAGGKYIQAPARWLRSKGWLNQEPEAQPDFTKQTGRQGGKRLTFWDVGEQMKRDGEA